MGACALKSILSAHRIGLMVKHMQHAIVLDFLSPLLVGVAVDDLNDALPQAMAQTGKADYPITGDRHTGC